MFGVEYDSAAKAAICAGTGFVPAPTAAGFSNPSNCAPNWSVRAIGSRTLWNPVPDLDVGFDVAWYHLNTAFAGTATLGANGAKPGGLYNISNQDAVGATFRIQRNFLY
jgi:hypothetical protein